MINVSEQRKQLLRKVGLMVEFTKKQAKEYMTRYHSINTNDLYEGHDGLLKLMRKLHTLQYDPLDVVGKNTDLTLQARIKNYHKGDINYALYETRTLLDGWDKMMGVNLTEDYSKLEEVRKWRTNLEVQTLKKRLQINALEYEDRILSIIKEGPKFASELKKGDKVDLLWGSKKISTATLDYLFHKGLIGVRKRNNTQKQYDLMERLIKEHYISTSLSREEFKEYYLLRRIESLGIMRDKKGIHLAGPFIYDNQSRRTILKKLLAQNKVEELQIEGVKDPCYRSMRYQNLENVLQNKISFLAPLDNMLWDRDLIKMVFDFDYKWEVYTPKDKRRYGYYVLPILYRDSMIGRIEFEKQRKSEPLIVKQVWLEKRNKTIEEELKKALISFQKYLGASSIEYR